jgi:hypothetical protein
MEHPPPGDQGNAHQGNAHGANAQGQPGAPSGAPSGAPQQGVGPDQIISNINQEALQGWTILMTMVLTRVDLDETGATREDRQTLIGFWHESFVQPHIDRWADEIDTPRNRQQLMGSPVTADDLIERIRMLGPQLQQKFLTYIMRGVDNPVSSVSEAVADFQALREEQMDSSSTGDGSPGT